MDQAAFSPDGRHLVTVSRDRTVRVWDAATGLPVSPPMRQGPVDRAVFSPDGRRLATAGSGAVRVWDAATGQPVSPPLELEVLCEPR